MAQGRTQGLFQALYSLMDSMNFTLEQAMEALKIPKEEQEQYKKIIANKKSE